MLFEGVPPIDPKWPVCRVVVALALACVATPSITSAETCFEPAKPDALALYDSGYGTQETREAFQTYFLEVEEFLNCWNQVSFRVRDEARAASNEYAEALRAYPANDGRGSGDGGDGGFVRSSASLTATGELIMDAAE